ncbi:MAG: sigma factor [Ilumatobacteraceae bacterium]
MESNVRRAQRQHHRLADDQSRSVGRSLEFRSRPVDDGGFDPSKGSLRTYLTVLARGVAIDHLRRDNR